MDYKKLSLDELENLDLMKMEKEEIEEVKNIAERHKFIINMGDTLTDGDYRAMEQCKRIARKCEEYLECEKILGGN